jgi:hypothetical protein
MSIASLGCARRHVQLGHVRRSVSDVPMAAGRGRTHRPKRGTQAIPGLASILTRLNSPCALTLAATGLIASRSVGVVKYWKPDLRPKGVYT